MPTIYKMVSSDYPTNTFVRLKAKGTGSGQNAIQSFEVQLPLPNYGLTHQSSFDWSTDTLPVIASNAIDKFAQSSGSIKPNEEASSIETLTTDIKNAFDSISGTEVGSSLKKQLLTSVSSWTTGSTAAANYAFQKLDGTVYNPNKQLFFDGISQPVFTMTFDIVAQNAPQAIIMATAIKQIRLAASPSYSNEKMFFTYPSYFIMDIVVNGTTILQRPDFAITSINTNMSPNGVMSWHKDGKPVAYTLELSGIECNVATSDIEKQRKFLGV